MNRGERVATFNSLQQFEFTYLVRYTSSRWRWWGPEQWVCSPWSPPASLWPISHSSYWSRSENLKHVKHSHGTYNRATHMAWKKSKLCILQCCQFTNDRIILIYRCLLFYLDLHITWLQRLILLLLSHSPLKSSKTATPGKEPVIH